MTAGDIYQKQPDGSWAFLGNLNSDDEAAPPTLAQVEALFTAKGQLLAGTGAAAAELLVVGSARYQLTVGGADPSGLEWYPPTGFDTINAQTASYLVTAGDTAKVVTMTNTTSTGITATLPAAAPAAPWHVCIINTTSPSSTVAAPVTISPNSLQLNGSSSSLTIYPGQAIVIFSDGSNYEGFVSGGGSQVVQTFDGSGTSTVATNWPCPSGITAIDLTIIGAGGGGGGAAVAGGAAGGAGGNCGVGRRLPVIPGHTYQVVAGGGGTAGAATGTSGGNGAVSNLNDPASGGILVQASGGNGGGPSTGGTVTGGTIGASWTFNVLFTANAAAGGNGTGSTSGQGGGAAGDAQGASGTTGGTGNNQSGGNGGAAQSGGTSKAGVQGTAPGGGASGGWKNGAAMAGAPGQPGRVRIAYPAY